MVTTVNTSKTATPTKAAVPAKLEAMPAATSTASKAKRQAVAKKVLAKTAVKKAAKPSTKASVSATVTPKSVKPLKEKKPKLVRDSFTMPKAEYVVIDELKTRAGKLSSPIKKSELLRAGIKALAAMADSAFLAALKAVPTIKTGRPAKV